MKSQKPTVRTLITAALMVVIAAGCASGPDRKELQTVIEDAAQVFEHGSLPPGLVNRISRAQVTLLGETHYVQEHQEMLVALFPELQRAGYRQLGVESMQAFGWILDDYVRGSRDDYPQGLAPLDSFWIEGLRDFNAPLAREDQIGVFCFDMNHWSDSFQQSLLAMSRELDHPELKRYAGEILLLDPGSTGYRRALESLYTLELSDPWMERLTRMVEIEEQSIGLRDSMKDSAREALIIRLVEEQLDAGTGKVVVNTGMFHAQRQVFMGTIRRRLGTILDERYDQNPDALFSLAVFGFTGERRNRFYDTESVGITPPWQRKENNLTRLLWELPRRGEGGNIFIPLDDPLFQESMGVAYSFDELRAAPGRQFDAYLVFSSISVLRSMQ